MYTGVIPLFLRDKNLRKQTVHNVKLHGCRVTFCSVNHAQLISHQNCSVFGYLPQLTWQPLC